MVVPIGRVSLRRREARMDFLVGHADGLFERGAGPNLAHDGLACQGAGQFTAGMAAHAVGHQPQPQFAVAVVGVFVQFAAQTGVGQVSEFEHGPEK